MPLTSLEKIFDNRSGEKLELVFMAFNEESRIGPILSYYSQEFDVVILDGGSDDGTLELVQEAGGSAFKRVGENVGENHFTFYVNHCTKSGRCFYMMCDEFVDLRDLARASEVLSDQNGRVFGRRIDWFYGVKGRNLSCVLPKGFSRGGAKYDSSNLHDTLHYETRLTGEYLAVDVHHLHVFSMKDDYGKFGNYIYHEIKEIRSAKRPLLALFVRILKLARTMQLGVFRFWRSPWVVIFLFFQLFASIFLFLMSYIEQSKLKSKADQLIYYRQVFSRAANKDL
jgi:glycosyltransferase involved in cell wall biosynthesis